jgi:hypothetical protein
MECVGCGSAAVSERSERTAQSYRRFRCRACGKGFNERSAGVLNRTQYPSDVIALGVLWRLRDCVARIHHDRYQGIMLRMRVTSRPKSENIATPVSTRNESQFCATNNLLKLPAICPGGQSDPCNPCGPSKSTSRWALAARSSAIIGAGRERAGMVSPRGGRVPVMLPLTCRLSIGKSGTVLTASIGRRF